MPENASLLDNVLDKAQQVTPQRQNNAPEFFNDLSTGLSVPQSFAGAIYTPTMQQAQIAKDLMPLPHITPDSTDAEKDEYVARAMKQRQAQTALAYLNQQWAKDPNLKQEFAKVASAYGTAFRMTDADKALMVQANANKAFADAIQKTGYLPAEIVQDPNFVQYASPEVMSFAKTLKDMNDERTGESTGPFDTIRRAFRFASEQRQADLDFRDQKIDQAEYERRMSDAFWNYGSTGNYFSDELAQVAAGFALPFTDIKTWELVEAGAIAGMAAGATAGAIGGMGVGAVPGAAGGIVAGGLAGLATGLGIGAIAGMNYDDFRQEHGRMMYRSVAESGGKVTQADAYNLAYDGAIWHAMLNFGSTAVGTGMFTRAARKLSAAWASAPSVGTEAFKNFAKSLDPRANFKSMMAETGGSILTEAVTEGAQGAVEEHTVNKITGNNKSEALAFGENFLQAAKVMGVFGLLHASPRFVKAAWEWKIKSDALRNVKTYEDAVSLASSLDPQEIAAVSETLNRTLGDTVRQTYLIDDVMEAAEEGRVDLDKLGDEFHNLPEKKAAGQVDISIPVGDYLSKYAKNPEAKKLDEIMRLTKGGMTTKEIKDGLTKQVAMQMLKRQQEKLQQMNVQGQELSEIESAIRQAASQSKGFDDPVLAENVTKTLGNCVRAFSDLTGLAPKEVFSQIQPGFGDRPFDLEGNNPRTLGGFEPQSMKFIYTQSGNAVTLLHELGHYFLESAYRMDEYMQQKGLTEQGANLHNMLADLEKAAGVEPGSYRAMDSEARAKYHELFVNNFLTSIIRDGADKDATKIMRAAKKFLVTALHREDRANFDKAVQYFQASEKLGKKQAMLKAAELALHNEYTAFSGEAPLNLNPHLSKFVDALYAADEKTFQDAAQYDLQELANLLVDMPGVSDQGKVAAKALLENVSDVEDKMNAENTKINWFVTDFFGRSSKQIENMIKLLKGATSEGDKARLELLRAEDELRKSPKFRELLKGQMDLERSKKINQAYWMIKGTDATPGTLLDRKAVYQALPTDIRNAVYRKLDSMGLLTDKGGFEPLKSSADGWLERRDFIKGCDAFTSLLVKLANREPYKKAAFAHATYRLFRGMGRRDLLRFSEKVKDTPLALSARADFLMKEIKLFDKMISEMGGAPRLRYHSALPRMAEDLIQFMPVNELEPRQLLNQAQAFQRKAVGILKTKGKQGETLLQKMYRAADCLQEQRLLVLEAMAAEKARNRALSRLDRVKKLCKKSDRDLAKTHNVNVMIVPRYIMSRLFEYSMQRADNQLRILRQYAPEQAERLDAFIQPDLFNKPARDLQLRDLNLALDVAEAGINEARNEHKVDYTGGKWDAETAKAELLKQTEENGLTKIRTVDKNNGGGQDYLEDKNYYEFKAAQGIKRWIIKPQMRFEALGKPFVEHFYKPVRASWNQYVQDRTQWYKDLNVVINGGEIDGKPVKGLKQILQEHPGKIEVPELAIRDNVGNEHTLVFGATGAYTDFGLLEMMGMLMHIGTQSSYDKLLIGHGWTAEQFDAALHGLERRGYLTQDIMDVVQNIWDLNKGICDKAQKAYYNLHGYYFRELEPRKIVAFGKEYDGGYVPALTNRELAKYNPAVESSVDPGAASDQDLDISMPFTTSRAGISLRASEQWANERNPNYNQPLSFDFVQLLQQNEQVIRYADMMPICRAIERMCQSDGGELINALTRMEPRLWQQFIHPWLKEAAQGQPWNPRSMWETMFNRLISRTGAAIMCFNLSNTLQQVTGLSVALTRVGPLNLAKGLSMIFDGGARKEMLDLSLFMKNRLEGNQTSLHGAERSLILSPSMRSGALRKTQAALGKAQEWSGKWAYIMQKKAQDIIDVSTWHGSYLQHMDALLDEQAKLGKNEEQINAMMPELKKKAAADADLDVIATQNSYDSIDLTGVEKKQGFLRALIMFGSYFYSIASLLYGEWVKANRMTDGALLRKMYVATTAFVLPNIIADAISKWTGGQDVFTSDDDDDTPSYQFYSKRWFDTVFGSQLRSLAGMIPVAGQMINSLVDSWQGKNYYTNTRYNSPVFTTASAAGQSFIDLAINDQDFSYKDMRNIGQGLGAFLGIAPVAAAARLGSYQYGVWGSGELKPEDALDFWRGTFTGRASDASKGK